MCEVKMAGEKRSENTNLKNIEKEHCHFLAGHKG